ncbi:hypothetical protein DFS33DRAFT_1278507 [Desarmillaria ectypa]|nr:hypothetical protein DFS33DRAFT_1278507 [Desarmillaria ectypa]
MSVPSEYRCPQRRVDVGIIVSRSEARHEDYSRSLYSKWFEMGIYPRDFVCRAGFSGEESKSTLVSTGAVSNIDDLKAASSMKRNVTLLRRREVMPASQVEKDSADKVLFQKKENKCTRVGQIGEATFVARRYEGRKYSITFEMVGEGVCALPAASPGTDRNFRQKAPSRLRARGRGWYDIGEKTNGGWRGCGTLPRTLIGDYLARRPFASIYGVVGLTVTAGLRKQSFTIQCLALSVRTTVFAYCDAYHIGEQRTYGEWTVVMGFDT